MRRFSWSAIFFVSATLFLGSIGVHDFFSERQQKARADIPCYEPPECNCDDWGDRTVCRFSGLVDGKDVLWVLKDFDDKYADREVVSYVPIPLAHETHSLQYYSELFINWKLKEPNPFLEKARYYGPDIP